MQGIEQFTHEDIGLYVVFERADLDCVPAISDLGTGGDIRQADINERAPAAIAARTRSRRLAATVEPMHRGCKSFGASPQFGGEGYLQAPARLSVEDGSGENSRAKHLLQTQGLRAELYHIAVIRFPLAALVLHWIRLGAELDDIGAPGEPQSAAFQHQPADGAQVSPAGLPRQIGVFMQEPAFGSQPILRPRQLQVNETPLPWAKSKMLQPANRKGFTDFGATDKIVHGKGVPGYVPAPDAAPDARSSLHRDPLFHRDSLGHFASKLD